MHVRALRYIITICSAETVGRVQTVLAHALLDGVGKQFSAVKLYSIGRVCITCLCQAFCEINAIIEFCDLHAREQSPYQHDHLTLTELVVYLCAELRIMLL